MKDFKKARILIAIPAYNEERNLPGLLKLLVPRKKDVLVVDDNSHDNTVAIVKEMGYSCLSNKKNIGLSAFFMAVRWHAVRPHYTHIISIDADGQHDPRYLPEFIEALTHFDLVSGNRFHDLAGIPDCKIAANTFAILLFKKFLNLKFPDVACGFRAISVNSLSENTAVERFGIIYEMLVSHAFSGKPTGFVNIPAIYPNNIMLNTNCEEIIGLLSVLRIFNESRELAMIESFVNRKTDFHITLSDIPFKATFQPPGAYFFETDLGRAKAYLTECNN